METADLAYSMLLNWNATFHTVSGNQASWEPLKPETVRQYTETGMQAYQEHYPHLWQGGDPSPYLERHFNPEKVLEDLHDPALRHALLYYGSQTAGILKLDFGKDSGDFYPGEALFIEKIYLKKAFTGLGLGSALLENLCDYARRSGCRGLWLETMYKGPARAFYRQQGFHFLAHAAVPYPEILPAERAMWVMGREV